MRLGPAVFANAFLLTAAFGTGTLLKRLIPKSLRKLDRLAIILLGGLGILSTLIFVIGMVRFSRVVVLAILLPAAMLGVWSFLKGSDDGGWPLRLQISGQPFIALLIIVLVLAVTFLSGLAEPVGDFHSSDAIAYHYLGPRVWLRTGIIRPVPDESLTGFPAVVETLFASLLAIGGTRAMALFSFLSLALFLLVSYGFARRLELDSVGACWATVLVCSMPAVYRGCFDGFNDVVLWSFVLVSLRLALDADGPNEAVLAGLFSGFAMGTKYLALITTPLILVCALLFHTMKSPKATTIFNRLLLFAAIAVSVALPWYVRNWMILGSPIYPPTPMLARWFHVRYMSGQAVGMLAAVVEKGGHGMGHDFLSFVLLPFRFTFHPANYLNGAGGVGLIPLALAPFGILIRFRDLFARIVLLFLFLWTIAWFLTEQDARFLINVFAILSAFGIWGWRFVVGKAPRFGARLAAFAVVCSILYGLIMIIPKRASDIHATVSPHYEAQREAQEIPFIESFTWINQNPRVKRVLVLEPLLPVYYLTKDYIKPVGRFGEETFPGSANLTELLNDLPRLGVTHVLDVDAARLLDVQYTDRAEHNFRIPANQANLRIVLNLKDQRIYEVVPRN